MVDRPGIRALEERALNAWPARQTIFQDGWVFRLSDGYTKRANSANALTPQGDFSAVRAAAESLYARHSLPTIFRLTPLAPADADGALEEAGYEHLDATIVMTRDMGSDETDDQNVAISSVPTPEWCAGFAAAHQIAPDARRLHDRIISSIAPPAAFATITEAGAGVGYGIAVTDNGMT
ncbi:MAG: GNAT family N-acetyltransferase, partial [Rhodospirillaceae bacterium]|nr:GNAT family N-acetyltransferase [Rhodospirillaceae bacterium]